MRIEQYALIGDTHTAALVGLDGSIDWLCLPRFDAPACFAALVGEPDNGFWKLAPAATPSSVTRRYRGDTLVLETTYVTEQGSVRVTDCMPISSDAADVVRIVDGLSGQVDMAMQLVIRFDYGHSVPWVRRSHGRLQAIAGPDALTLHTPIETNGAGLSTIANFTVTAGQRVPFVLTWHPSHRPGPRHRDADQLVNHTVAWWEHWKAGCTTTGPHRDLVMRSLITLKALTYAPTGGLIAAPTTSLPEQVGGVRNWDYRYCWLRDATFSLYALMAAGFTAEATAWRDWLLRAVAGSPDQLQIMYGPAGERRLPELELDWLSGYEGSRPVRTGNAASGQFQLDVYGEVMDCLHQARHNGIHEDPSAWGFQRALMEFLEGNWRRPDAGIWEIRGPRRMFTHSKVMAWVAADRAVKAIEGFGLDGPLDRWRTLRADIHRDVCENGFDAEAATFTQSYGQPELDASLLLIALVGFLPPTDERIVGTVSAIQARLMSDGFVRRYDNGVVSDLDGLPPGEGAFLPCTLWLADNLILQGRQTEGRALFERVASLANDVGLLAEEYDTTAERFLGNFPQAFSHVALVNTAHNLSSAQGPAQRRCQTP